MTVLKLQESFLSSFNSILRTSWALPDELISPLGQLLNNFQNDSILPLSLRRHALLALVNRKLRLNASSLMAILDSAAKHRVFFHYHDKQRILHFLDGSKLQDYTAWLQATQLPARLQSALIRAFSPLSQSDTIALLHQEIDSSGKGHDILQSLFGGYVFSSFDQEQMHRFFNPECRHATTYPPRFFDYLKEYHPHVLQRNCALLVVTIDPYLLKRFRSHSAFRNALLTFIEKSYSRLSNHCYLCIFMKGLGTRAQNLAWELYSDIVLFAEKHRETPLAKGYFHPAKIEFETKSYIPEIDLRKVKFDLANEGFFYKDCFVLLPPRPATNLPSRTDVPYDLLILFQKNERDETLIPCPSCRSHDVQGNSYPVLGVRSWECNNAFCPDRSKFNRGKRYGLSSIIKQEAIEKRENSIPRESILKWKRDVVDIVTETEVYQMLVRHYTLHGDKIVIVGGGQNAIKNYGRNILYEQFPVRQCNKRVRRKFLNSSFFHRFRVSKELPSGPLTFKNLSSISNVQVFNGNAFEVLQTIADNSVDGAITSPPYYNARLYSQWANIYCYLYDMYNIARQVHRVLKEGSPFLFNIFDYFDNERIIAFSAMGKKRMILGAYIIHLFQQCGFKLCGNVIWDKGEIEGKRSYNQGNMSPYYQAPHNCWEHVFVFSKGPLRKNIGSFPTLLRANPVVKMVNGKNIIGHSAPFPAEIPNLLLDTLGQQGLVLDPFSGSMTTGRTAFHRGFASINIDYQMEYCRLGIRLIQKEAQQLSLF